ncbi:hypothetical protein SGQ83_19720 [Flavobacterium sp. Fl-318]|uniref:Outer membrane protein beta-barrel domain-containing protein n=1 Tax=Flavobacterium cupriresistens TaxID=2893885 RepID=A0ABU4RI69_9FLAO|nr:MULTISPECIES: hypothetical protein [unclassified Flavobacterium]MDX6191593.1 hypothetical protein [Flavobacterium sp. Fl-318]UFH41540.1 hypothetical protein LNP23_17185 [Flavobacterium sp. F-323]
MKTSIVITMLFCIITGSIKAQDFDNNEVHVAYSDGFTLGAIDSFSNILPTAIIDGFTGEKTKIESESSFGMIEAGYRYQITDRSRVGLDLGYQNYSSKMITEKTSKTVKRAVDYILILPTANYTYLRIPLVDLYGSASIGAYLTNEKITETNQNVIKNNSIDLGWQVNPIGLRVGEKLSGFAELGFGIKGFVTAGVNYKF